MEATGEELRLFFSTVMSNLHGSQRHMVAGAMALCLAGDCSE